MSDPFDPAEISPETHAFNVDLEARLAALPRPMDVEIALTRKARAEGRGIFPVGGPLEGPVWHALGDQPEAAPAVRISSPDTAPAGTYLHFHGGGWTFGAPEQHDADCLALARVAGARVVSVRYRLAPEHPWPAQIEDALTAARWALASAPGPVVIGGESAGAHLALLTALRLEAEGHAMRLAGLALTYGMFDLSGTPSARAWGARYLVLSTPVIRWFVSNLTGGAQGEALRDPALSPLYAELAGMPPALLLCGTADPLIDDTLFLAARLRAAGAEAECDIVPGGIHAFDQFDLAIAREARARRADFVRRRLAAGA